MTREAFLLETTALLRSRAPWALAVAAAAALWARTFPAAAEIPELETSLAGAVLVILLARGSGARDVRTGAALLWLQRTGRPAGRYGARLAAVAFLAVLGHGTVAVGLSGLGVVPLPATAGVAARLVLVDLSVVAVAFAVAAVGPPLEALWTVALLLLLAGPAVDALLDPAAGGALAPALAAVRFPALEIRALERWLDGGVRPGTWTAARPFLHLAGWSALGLLLLELRAGLLRLPRRTGAATRVRDGSRSPRPPPPRAAPRR